MSLYLDPLTPLLYAQGEPYARLPGFGDEFILLFVPIGEPGNWHQVLKHGVFREATYGDELVTRELPLVFFSGTAPTAVLNVRIAGVWTTGKLVKARVGGSWVTKPLKVYKGGAWVTVT